MTRTEKYIRPITLEIREKIWEEWKVTVPRDKTLSEALEELILKALEKKNKKNLSFVEAEDARMRKEIKDRERRSISKLAKKLKGGK